MPSYTKLAAAGALLLIVYIICFGWKEGLRIWVCAIALGGFVLLLAGK